MATATKKEASAPVKEPVLVSGTIQDGLSRQSQFSTYAENKSDDLAPDAGPQVIQTLGKGVKS